MKIVPRLLFVCFQVWHVNDYTSCCVFNLTSWICTSCDEVVHRTYPVLIIIWSPWICEVWGPIRHGGEAGSGSWRPWMVFKIVDNVEAGRMIWRLLQKNIDSHTCPWCYIVLVFKSSFFSYELCVSGRFHVYCSSNVNIFALHLNSDMEIWNDSLHDLQLLIGWDSSSADATVKIVCAHNRATCLRLWNSLDIARLVTFLKRLSLPELQLFLLCRSPHYKVEMAERVCIIITHNYHWWRQSCGISTSSIFCFCFSRKCNEFNISHPWCCYLKLPKGSAIRRYM